VPVLPCRLPVVLRLLIELRTAGAFHSFDAIVRLARLGVSLGGGVLGGGDEFFEFADAFGVEGGAFVADFADDALGGGRRTLAGFFFFISKARRSAAQSRQRSWLQASIRMSSGSFLHLVQGWGCSIILWQLHINSIRPCSIAQGPVSSSEGTNNRP
jgi:hypothetical protein